MAFPSTPPANGTLHVENGISFIVVNGKWEKYELPVCLPFGSAMGDGGFLNRNWANFHWGPISQHLAIGKIVVRVVFKTDTNCFVDMGFRTPAEPQFILSADYSNSRGFVQWGDSGVNVGSYATVAFKNNGVWASLHDASRECMNNLPQILKVNINPLGTSSSVISWEFIQQVASSGKLVLNVGKINLNRPTSNLTGMFIRVSSGNLLTGNANLEIF